MNLAKYEVSDPRWDVSLEDVPHDVYHLSQYVAADDTFRKTSSSLFVVTEGEFRLCVPLTLREIPDSNGLFDATSPYGYPAPVASPHAPLDWIQEAFQFLIESLREQRCVTLFLRLHPLIGVTASQLDTFGTVVGHGVTVSMPLNKAFDEIRADMRKTNRYEIRKSLREGQVAEIDENWQHFEDFYYIYTSTMDRLGASTGYYFSRDYFLTLRDNLPDNVFLWTTKIDGKVAAASLITECEGIVQYHLSGTHPDYYPQYPTKVLLDAVAAWANERGNGQFHLGGGLGGQEDSLFAFKAGFGKGRHPFSTMRIIVLQREYDELVLEWERTTDFKADNLTGFFPPYRKNR